MTRSFPILLGLCIYSLSLITPLWASALPFDGDTHSLTLDRRFFGSDESSGSSSSSSSSKSSKKNAAGTAEELIDFMQVIMEGGIQSQQCWITLVNATQSELGPCLGLTTLSTLVVQGSNYSFSNAVDDYLTDICSSTKCTTASLKYWRWKLGKDCAGGDMAQPLMRTLDVVMGQYESSLYDLACKVHYNGTAPYCLSEILNSTQTTNSKEFFTNILTGTNINWYDQSFFSQQICTGCMHEFYKAAMFLIPHIRTLSEMVGLGGVLSTCQSTDIPWHDICDQTKPDALSVEAATATLRSAGVSNQINILMGAASLTAATIWLML